VTVYGTEKLNQLMNWTAVLYVSRWCSNL